MVRVDLKLLNFLPSLPKAGIDQIICFAIYFLSFAGVSCSFLHAVYFLMYFNF